MINERPKNQSIKGDTKMIEGVLIWVQQRPRRVTGVILGFLAGLLYHYLGFLDTLILILFVVIGLVVGKYLDERKEVGQILDRLFTSDR
jgi:uncharacterized membrane protein